MDPDIDYTSSTTHSERRKTINVISNKDKHASLGISLARFGTLTKNSIRGLIPKRGNDIISTYTSKNKKQELQLVYEGEKLFLKMSNSTSKKSLFHRKSNNQSQNIKAWIWDIELEFFLEYAKLIYHFCMLSDRESNVIYDDFQYIFKHDSDNIIITFSPKQHRKKIRYDITMTNFTHQKVNFRLLECDVIIFLTNILSLDV